MDLDPFARRILDLTREARTPNERDRRRVDRALSASLGLAAISGVATANGATAAKSAATALLFKWTAGAAVVASAVTAAYFGLNSSSDGDGAAMAPTLAALQPAPTASPPPEKVVEAPVPAPVPDKTANVESAAKPAPRRAPDKAQRADTLNEELDLLHEAQAAWRNRNPTAALSLLAQHRKSYPKSALGPEREALRVLSLCAAGRTQEAKDVARRSFRDGSRSPFRTAVDESCIKD